MIKRHRVLIVEDDETLLGVLRYNLEKEGYGVISAQSGAKALDSARQRNPDLIILDIMLPDLDGFEVCRILRRESATPIIMLTAKSQELDKVVGLELGADDYVTKPFSMRELLARVKALLRRSETLQPPGADLAKPIRSGNLEMDPTHHLVNLEGKRLELSPKEFDLLRFLMQSRTQVFSRELLLERIWGYDYLGDPRTVDVHIRWLRQKIEDDPAHPKRLITVRGFGYKFEG